MMNPEDNDNFPSAFAVEALREQRLSRRWSNFFKAAFLLYLLGFALVSIPPMSLKSLFSDAKITALIDIQGVISSTADANSDMIVTGLRAAFEEEKTAGVIVRINSPGGSPVQSGYINDEIYRLKHEYPNIPVYAVIQDVGASGGYYVAVAADEIYADKSSIVGSIGVRIDGFGFVESLGKLGVERRLLTSGANKGFLDPFSPLKEEDVQHVSGVLKEIHEQFIALVKKGRGNRLVDSPELFSGYVWSGERCLELGLIDALGSASFVAREIIGAEEIVDFTPQHNVLDQFARRVGAAVTDAFLNSSIGLH